MIEIQQQLERIHETLHHLDKHAEGIRVAGEKLNDWSIDHEKRLRFMEKWQGSISPFFTGGVFLLGVIVTVVASHLF